MQRSKYTTSTHPRESSTHERAIAALTQQFHVPIDHVAQLYERELAVLTAGARVTSFLTILTIRKVREILRQRSHPWRAPEALTPREVDARAHARITPPRARDAHQYGLSEATALACGVDGHPVHDQK
jgi:hypothetical protein